MWDETVRAGTFEAVEQEVKDEEPEEGARDWVWEALKGLAHSNENDEGRAGSGGVWRSQHPEGRDLGQTGKALPALRDGYRADWVGSGRRYNRRHTVVHHRIHR